MTINNPRVNGRILNTSNDNIKKDLANESSTLYNELKILLEGEVCSLFSDYYLSSVMFIANIDVIKK